MKVFHHTLRAALVLAISLPSLAGAQGATKAPPQAPSGEPLSLERPGDGSPVCGLGKEFHAGRRAALRARLKEGLVVIRGLPGLRDYGVFSQDKTFWYLTGVESEDAALVMDCKSGKETLFLPAANKRREGWDGELWDAGDEWVRKLTGFDEVLPSKDLPKVLEERIAKKSKVWVSMHPNVALTGCSDSAGPYDEKIAKDPLDGRPSREQAFATKLRELYGAEVENCSDELTYLRRVKTPEEVAAMRRAGRAGALAMAEGIRSTRPGLGEWDLDALMTWIQAREGAAGAAYHAIVGSGKNSLVLHYGASSRRMQDGEILLIDYGPEVDHYTTDITRTWPVNGKFSARQAELYDAVLAAQKAGIAAVKPGAKIGDIERACADVLKERGFGKLTRHGACHYIGMEVHDPGDYEAAFEPGVAFTVEPGLYEEATGIGIRIEDVVVVTKDGCEVVSSAAPKERAEIEALVQAAGVLDSPSLR